MATTYELIASNTLTSSTASVTFSAIPNTFTDLVLKISSRQTGTSDVQDSISVAINGPAGGTLYSATRIRGDGSSATSNRQSNTSQWILEQGSTAGGNTSNTFANDEIYIANYTVSQSKVASGFSAHEDNSTLAYLRANAFLWRSNTAISSLVLKLDSGQNFISGSSFFLYGIKNS